MALTQEPNPLLTDPLALRFMTGDQMGYMPAAQYLTPAEYGAFRTVPGPAGHNYMHQDPGLLQSLLIRNRGSLPGMSPYFFNTYNPAVNQQQYMYTMNAKADDSLMAMGGAVLDVFNPLSITSGLLLGGIPGLAAGMMMPSVSRPFLDRIRDMRGIQNLTMSKIVGGADLNQATGAGFNTLSARNIDSFLRIQSSGDALLKQGDWRKLLELGVENGQFDYAGNVEQYKDALKKLRKSVTTIMEVAGSTDFKDLMKEYKRMRTMGAGLDEYVNIARKEDLYSRITGMRHEDMVNTFGQQGALIYQQAGLTGYQGSLQAMHNAASITLMQRTGLLTPGALSRYGGLSGMTQVMTQQSAEAQNRMSDFMLPYFMNQEASGLDDNASLMDVLNSSDPLGMLGRSAGRKTGTLAQRMAFDRNRGDLMQKFQERYGQETSMAVAAMGIGRHVNLKGLEAMEYGYRQLGFDPKMAHLKAKAFTSSDFREQEERELQLARRKQREEEAVANAPFRKLALALGKTFTLWGENIFGGMVDGYAKWAERRANHGNGLYNAGADMTQSYDWSEAMRNSGLGPEYGGEAQTSLPTARPVTDLAELAAPAVMALSDGETSGMGWNSEKGATYGIFNWDSEQAGKFSQWLKTRGKKGKEYFSKLEAAGGIRNFSSPEESQASSLAAVFAEIGNENKFRELQLKYAKKEMYDKALASLSPEERAQIMASPTAQKMFFADVMQGNVEIKEADEAARSFRIGESVKEFESGNKGILDIGHDSSGGTSYGKYQFSTTTPKKGKVVDGGSMHDFLKFLEEKGGETADISRRIKAAGPLNTGSKTGAAVEAYLREARANPELMENLQYEYIKRNHYDAAMKKLQSGSLRTMIESDYGLRELMWSTSVQHGAAGAKAIFNKVYREGMTRSEIIKAVMAERRTKFPTLKLENNKQWQAVQKRFTDETAQHLKAPVKQSYLSSPTLEAVRAGGGSLSQEQITQALRPWREKAEGDQKKLAVLDEMEKELLQGNLEDKYREGIDKGEAKKQEELKSRFDAEVQAAVEKISGEAEQPFTALWEAGGMLHETVDITHLDHVINRFENKADLEDGVVNFKGLAELVEKSSGKTLSTEQRSRLRSELLANSGAGQIKTLQTSRLAGVHVRNILKKADLGLDDKALDSLSQDPVLQAAMISSGLHSLSSEEAEEIIGGFRSRADEASEERRKKGLLIEEELYARDADLAFTFALPGVKGLGSEYKDAREALFKRTYKGADSTPMVLNLTRLAMLKKFATGPDATEAYKNKFREEARRNGFTDGWIERQLENINDFTLKDVRENKAFNAVTAEDMPLVNKVGEGTYQVIRRDPKRDSLLLQSAYDQDLTGKNSPLLKRQASIIARKQMVAATEFARRIDPGMKAKDLLTPEGLTKARRILGEGKLGTKKEDIRLIEDAWTKHREGKTLSYADFMPNRAGSMSAADEFTNSARNQDRAQIEASVQMAKEAREQQRLELEGKNGGTQSGVQDGAQLKDSTVARLNTVLAGLTELLKRWEQGNFNPPRK